MLDEKEKKWRGPPARSLLLCPVVSACCCPPA
jgi:hypothetical protein